MAPASAHERKNLSQSIFTFIRHALNIIVFTCITVSFADFFKKIIIIELEYDAWPMNQ